MTEISALWDCEIHCTVSVNKKLGIPHLIQLVEVGRHQTNQLTGADLIQDSAGQLQGLKRSKIRVQWKHKGRRWIVWKEAGDTRLPRPSRLPVERISWISKCERLSGNVVVSWINKIEAFSWSFCPILKIIARQKLTSLSYQLGCFVRTTVCYSSDFK